MTVVLTRTDQMIAPGYFFERLLQRQFVLDKGSLSSALIDGFPILGDVAMFTLFCMIDWRMLLVSCGVGRKASGQF